MNSERHLGHFVFDCFKSRPNVICQIDAGTGESETNASVLSRSVRLASSLRKFGILPGDVVALGGKNHLDVCIPYYAALFSGLPLLGIDPFYKYDEIKSLLHLATPKIAFCDFEFYHHYAKAVQELKLDTKIVTLRGKDCGMKKFIEDYQSSEAGETFEPAAIDLDSTFIWLISTSGTTGKSKISAFSHRVWIEKSRNLIAPLVVKSNKPALNLAPIHWITGLYHLAIMPLRGEFIVQTSLSLTTDHVIDIINNYKPRYVIFNPSRLTYILKHEKKCDFTCLDRLVITGENPPSELVLQTRNRVRKDATVAIVYGQTETLGPVMTTGPQTPVGSCGRPGPGFSVKLVDPDTEMEITEPYKTGELWTRGWSFSLYYNNPEETAKVFSKDGWYKTGDLLYRDEEGDYFYVERMKKLIKYQNYNLVPSELEDVIRSHPSVFDVALTSIPHSQDGEHPVACVVLNPGTTVTAQEIKDLIANKLSEKKQLRGGVVFLDSLPMTTNNKISMTKLKEIALTALRE